MLPLVLLFLPLVYVLAFMMLLFLPFVCTVATIIDARNSPEPADVKEVFTKLFIALVVLPLGILAFMVPIRAVLVGAASLYPPAMEVFNEMHTVIYVPLKFMFGDMGIYWLDFWWGTYGVFAIFLLALMDSIRRNMLVTQISILPTATIGSVAVGLAELKGKAVPIDDDTGPIIRSWLQQGDNGVSPQTRIKPFYMDDGTGRIVVDATSCSVNSESQLFDINLHQVHLKTHYMDKSLPESRLMAGDDVFLLGTVQIDRERKYHTETYQRNIVVKPQQSSLLRLNYFDLFFLSNQSEEKLLQKFRASIKRGWGFIVFLMIICAWLAIYGMINIQ